MSDDTPRDWRSATPRVDLATECRLSNEELAALGNTAGKLPRFRSLVTDHEAFDTLVRAVADSTRDNESIAQLRRRIRALGYRVTRVAKEISQSL